jgi:hypothetical protein
MKPGDLCKSRLDKIRLFSHDFRNLTERNDHSLWEGGSLIYKTDLLLVLESHLEYEEGKDWYRVLSPRGELGWLCSEFAVWV